VVDAGRSEHNGQTDHENQGCHCQKKRNSGMESMTGRRGFPLSVVAVPVAIARNREGGDHHEW
jgi:hypothetical protein